MSAWWDDIPDYDPWQGVTIAGRPKRTVVFSEHGNAKKFHRVEVLAFEWYHGRLMNVRGRTLCGNWLQWPKLSDAPEHLAPCRPCHFSVVVRDKREVAA